MTPETLDKLAEIARTARYGGALAIRPPWSAISELTRQVWRDVVRAVLDANVSGPQPSPEGGLKPGDVVSVRGVVEIAPSSPTSGVHVLLDEGCVTALVTPRTVTFIERPAQPEPDWQPGDLAEDDDGERYSYRADTSESAPWVWIKNGHRTARREIPGRLHKLAVTREDKAQ